MGYTIREQILRAIGTAIGTGYPSELKQAPCRCRLEPFSDSQLPGINWYPVTDARISVPSPYAPITRRLLTVRFDCHVCAPPASSDYPSIDGRADLELAFLTSKLGSSTLGGLVHSVTEGETSWQFDESNLDRAVVSIAFEIDYHTDRGSQLS